MTSLSTCGSVDAKLEKARSILIRLEQNFGDDNTD
jgi:hypothetical protein